MRTTKNQKFKNYIFEAQPQHRERFCSIVDIQDIYCNEQKAMTVTVTVTVTFSVFLNENTTTYKGILIRDYDLLRHHKGTLPYDHFGKDQFDY